MQMKEQSSVSCELAEVRVRTPSGVCDASLVQPRGQGQWPGVILFADAFGLRPAMRDIAKRMGGSMTLRAAAALPSRVGAGASFHGGALATDKPDSPHLLAPQIRAQYYFGVAANDDASEPEAKIKLREAFHNAGRSAKIEVYEGCTHGWCVKDMPASPEGKPIYNEAAAERAWNELLMLFKRAVV